MNILDAQASVEMAPTFMQERCSDGKITSSGRSSGR
jgi:hypothetical protein